jgi:hypothetical protein
MSDWSMSSGPTLVQDSEEEKLRPPLPLEGWERTDTLPPEEVRDLGTV